MSDTTVIFSQQETTVQFVEHSTNVAFPTSLPGPQGPPGAAGGSTVEVTAGEALNAGRVVVVIGGLAYHFQPTDPTHAGGAYGITTTSGIMGGSATVQRLGTVTDAAFLSLPEGVAWVTANGALTGALPTSGAIQKAGFKIDSDQLFVDFSIQIT